MTLAHNSTIPADFGGEPPLLPGWGPGRLVAGKYLLERELAAGGMGSVWVAVHVVLQSRVAIKLLSPQISGSPQAVSRFMFEAQVASSLQSPHVVQIFDHGVDDGVPYIAMELLEGESLAERLASQGKISLDETKRIVTHVCRAIAKAHDSGVVHRDLKPSNIFIVKNDDEDHVKVLDFGIAKLADPLRVSTSSPGPPKTKTGMLIGTPQYMSPEQAQGTKAVDGRSDLWAIAVIAFECLVGRKAFDSDALGDLILKVCAQPLPVPSAVGVVPDGFDAWFARGVHRDVAQRFQTAQDMSRSFRMIGTLSDASGFRSVSAAEVSDRVVVKGAETSERSDRLAATPPGTEVPSARARRGRVWQPLVLLALGAGLTLLVLALRSASSTPTTPTRGAISSTLSSSPRVPEATSAPLVPATSAPLVPPVPSVVAPSETSTSTRAVDAGFRPVTGGIRPVPRPSLPPKVEVTPAVPVPTRASSVAPPPSVPFDPLQSRQ